MVKTARTPRFVHEFSWPADSELSTDLSADAGTNGGRINNVHTHDGNVHVIVSWPTREQAESFVRKFYDEAACDDALLAEMVADIHEI